MRNQFKITTQTSDGTLVFRSVLFSILAFSVMVLLVNIPWAIFKLVILGGVFCLMAGGIFLIMDSTRFELRIKDSDYHGAGPREVDDEY